MTTSNSNTQTTQQSQTAPGALGMPTLNGILGQLNPLIANSGLNSTESGAINQLTQNAAQGNPYATAIGNNATSLLAGGGAQAQDPSLSSGLSTLQSQLTPYANGSMVGNNPALAAQLAALNTQISGQVNGQFAAAGRTGSGQNSEALGLGLSQGEAPVIANQYNQDVANQLSAANTLYGAQNTTSGALSANQAAANANTQTGATAAGGALNADNYGANATLAAQQLGQSIPAQNLGLLAQIGIPIAGMNTTSSGSGTSSTQSTPSLLSSLGSLGSLFSAPANGTSAAAGLGQAAAGLGSAASSGLGSLASLFAFSDRRLKEDVVVIGALFDGTPVYGYRYIGAPAYHIGLMAQDVEKTCPEAVIEINGYKAVNYKAATEKSARMLDWGC